MAMPILKALNKGLADEFSRRWGMELGHAFEIVKIPRVMHKTKPGLGTCQRYRLDNAIMVAGSAGLQGVWPMIKGEISKEIVAAKGGHWSKRWPRPSCESSEL